MHYRINNIATAIIKTTNALSVPPTATGVTFESTFMRSASISTKKGKEVNTLQRLTQYLTNENVQVQTHSMYPAD